MSRLRVWIERGRDRVRAGSLRIALRGRRCWNCVVVAVVVGRRVEGELKLQAELIVVLERTDLLSMEL